MSRRESVHEARHPDVGTRRHSEDRACLQPGGARRIQRGGPRIFS